MRKFAAGALAVAGLMIAVLSFGGGPAVAAGGSCSGKLIELRKMVVNKKTVGELAVYYNSASGRNCARFNHVGWTRGKSMLTRVWVGICSERTPGAKTCHYDTATDAVDKGMYSYYAGPVTTKRSAAGRCIAASGYLWINGKRHTVGTNPWVGHCG